MNFIMVPLVTGIVTLGIYKFFELLICRRERREIIGKLEPGSLIDYLKLVPMGLRTGATIRTASETAPGALSVCWISGGDIDKKIVNHMYHQNLFVIYSRWRDLVCI